MGNSMLLWGRGDQGMEIQHEGAGVQMDEELGGSKRTPHPMGYKQWLSMTGRYLGDP